MRKRSLESSGWLWGVLAITALCHHHTVGTIMLPCCLLGSVELNLVFDCGNYPQFKLMAHSLCSFRSKALTPFPTEWAYCYCMCHFIKIRVSPKSFLGSKCGKNDEQGKETQMQEASHMWCKGTGKASPSCLASAAHLGTQCSCQLL